jgi:hypothetical protein
MIHLLGVFISRPDAVSKDFKSFKISAEHTMAFVHYQED